MKVKFNILPVAVATALLINVPVAFGKDICAVPKDQWQAQGNLTRKLESQGWKIRNIKIDSGCYEVYGTDGSGKARETHFNPKTLAPAAEFHQAN